MTITKHIYTAFAGNTLLHRGDLANAVKHAKKRADAGEQARIVLYEEHNGGIFDIDLSGSLDSVLARLPSATESGPDTNDDSAVKRRGRGRPKLGVVCREVSLLPRHWGWLSTQRGGASASLRRLIDSARKQMSQHSASQPIIEAAHRFIWDIAGNQVHFEDVTRCLFAADFDQITELTSTWPTDIREQLARYLASARLTATE